MLNTFSIQVEAQFRIILDYPLQKKLHFFTE